MSINGIMISENGARRSFIVNIRCGGLLVTMLLLIGSIAAPVSVAQSARDDQRERMQSEIWELQQELAKLRQIRTLELIEQKLVVEIDKVTIQINDLIKEVAKLQRERRTTGFIDLPGVEKDLREAQRDLQEARLDRERGTKTLWEVRMRLEQLR